MKYTRRITAMIEIKNVTKKYGNYVAVEDISFKVEESSIYGLLRLQ